MSGFWLSGGLGSPDFELERDPQALVLAVTG
jgi:hypothetical protein